MLDVSAAAIARAKARLGTKAHTVRWLEADVTGPWEIAPVDIWHDRAAFHFLIEPADRHSYIAHLRRALKPSGHAVLATFSLDGPSKCSGLPVVRYSPESLAAELGPDFSLTDAVHECHLTPSGAVQHFTFSVFRAARLAPAQ